MNEEVEVKDKTGAVALQRSVDCPEITFEKVPQYFVLLTKPETEQRNDPSPKCRRQE